MLFQDIFLMLGQGGQQNPLGTLPFLLAMVLVMYFFMLRPQIKRSKEQKEFSNSTTVGDSIITSAGIHGKIIKENEDGTLSVEIDRNTIVKMEKSAISMELTMAYRKKTTAASKAA
jgi:preprotein translocase subunit YajC